MQIKDAELLCSATIEIFARLQLYITLISAKISSATIEIFARLQPVCYIHFQDMCSATIEIFARLQLYEPTYMQNFKFCYHRNFC